MITIPDNYAALLDDVRNSMMDEAYWNGGDADGKEVAKALDNILKDILEHKEYDDWYHSLEYAHQQLKRLRRVV